MRGEDEKGRPPAYLWKRQRGRQGRTPQSMSGRPPGFLQGRQKERQGKVPQITSGRPPGYLLRRQKERQGGMPQRRKTGEARRVYGGWIGRRRLSRRGALWRTTVGSVGIPRPDAHNSSVPRPHPNGQEWDNGTTARHVCPELTCTGVRVTSDRNGREDC
jgi:hypothetical protein